MVGGIITADYCMKREYEHPVMLVITEDKKRENDFKKRIPMLMHYATNLDDIIIGNTEHIVSILKEIH